MTKVWAGVIALVLLLGFAWVSFDKQRDKAEPTAVPVVITIEVPAVEESLLPTVTPNPSVGNE